jgi:WD40 repeat protein
VCGSASTSSKQPMNTSKQPINVLFFSPDGLHVISCGGDRTVRLWHAATGVLLHTFTGHRDAVTCVRFSPDGRTILSGGGDNDCTLKLWSTDVLSAEREAGRREVRLVLQRRRRRAVHGGVFMGKVVHGGHRVVPPPPTQACY